MTATDPPALRLAGLSKAYAVPAVDRLDLTVASGLFYALLGPNGAGKTTTLRMVAGLLRADAGSIEVFGHDAQADPIEAKRLIAWLPDEPLLYDKLTPHEYLEFVAGLWAVLPEIAEARAESMLRRLGLWEHRAKRTESLSRGMKQKLALIGAMIHAPRLLILDEPLTGLDAGAAREVKDLLLEQVRAGCTVLLTTHVLEIAERLAKRIGILTRGRLIAEGSPAELMALADAASLEDAFLFLTDGKP